MGIDEGTPPWWATAMMDSEVCSRYGETLWYSSRDLELWRFYSSLPIVVKLLSFFATYCTEHTYRILKKKLVKSRRNGMKIIKGKLLRLGGGGQEDCPGTGRKEGKPSLEEKWRWKTRHSCEGREGKKDNRPWKRSEDGRLDTVAREEKGRRTTVFGREVNI
jgi:hypothetical protein